jgi:hypothetical protein
MGSLTANKTYFFDRATRLYEAWVSELALVKNINAYIFRKTMQIWKRWIVLFWLLEQARKEITPNPCLFRFAYLMNENLNKLLALALELRPSRHHFVTHKKRNILSWQWQEDAICLITWNQREFTSYCSALYNYHSKQGLIKANLLGRMVWLLEWYYPKSR